MRCTILFFGSFEWDEAELTTLLLRKGFHAHISYLDRLQELEERLENLPYDLLIFKSEAETLLKIATSIRTFELSYTPACLYILNEDEASYYDKLKDFAANNIIIGAQTHHNLASYISLVLKKERYKAELNRMGSYMKDATLVFEHNQEGAFVIVDANKAFLELESLKRNELVGKTIEMTRLNFKLSLLEDEIKEVYESGESKHMPSYFFMKAGQREWYELFIYRSNPNQVSLIASPLSEIKRTNDKAEAAKRYLQTILNAQKHMIYITDGEKLINTNDAFLKFTGFATMYDFIKAYELPRNIFEKSTQEPYIDTTDPRWLDRVAENPDEVYKVRIKKEDTIYIFIPSVEKVRIREMMQYVVILTDITELESEKEQLRVIAMTDPLTGACNRFKFNSVIEEQFANSKRYETPLSVIMFDVDHFKKVNDTYSHQVGDMVLKQIASIVRSEIRQSDLFIRWGGEEFMILLTNTPKESALVAAEKIRKSFENFEFDTVSKVTCSFGVAGLEEEDSVSKFISKADEAMYQAKVAGRNCVKVL